MLIRLIRNEPHGSALFGQLIVDDHALVMDTLEHTAYAISNGFYRVRLTYSPRFKEVLPILDGVYGYAFPNTLPQERAGGGLRTGIRIHAGNTIEHTTGCILVGEADNARLSPLTSHLLSGRLLSSRKRLNELRNYLLNYQKQNPYEEIYVCITSPNPYPDGDTSCCVEAQSPQ